MPLIHKGYLLEQVEEESSGELAKQESPGGEVVVLQI